jgi:serine/threonine protein kinase/Tol biopolymer transport system component
MSKLVDQLGKAIVAAGLMPADELQSLWSSIPSGERPRDAETFAKFLVDRETLTEFQSQVLLTGTDTPLVLGDYVLLSKIGAGGMGQVFKAKHRHMDRLVAIKLLPPDLTKDEEAVRRFQREVKAAAKLSHPNIVQAHDASVQRGVWYLVLEFVDGSDLASHVAKQGPLPVAGVIDFILQAAKGLAYAHDNGIVHRDIKPANLLLDNKGVVKVLDMGLARVEGAAPTSKDGLTQSGQVMGTVDYMAPEQATDVRHVDGRSDIYSLGCTMFRLLIGRSMYDGETMVQKLMAHQQAPIPSLTAHRSDIPEGLVRVYERMVAKKPEQRYKSMREVEQALNQIAARLASDKQASADDAPSLLTSLFRSVTGGKNTAKSPGRSVTIQSKPGIKEAPADGFAPTVSLGNALQGTDPVSDRSIQVVKEDSARTAKRSSRKWPPIKLIAGGAAGALILIFGIWAIVKDKNGKEVGATRVTVKPNSQVSNFRSQNLDPPPPYDLLISPDYDWTMPENLGPLINTPNEDGGPTLSADGLTLIFESNRTGGKGNMDLWMSRRASLAEAWSEPESLGSVINSSASEFTPTLSADGQTLVYATDRATTPGDYHLWFSSRRTPTSAWTAPRRLFDTTIEPAGIRSAGPALFPDALELIFHSNSRDGANKFDLWRSRRKSPADPWGMPENLGTTINSAANDVDPEIASDGRVLLFKSDRDPASPNAMWWCSRPTWDAPWSTPQKIGGSLDAEYRVTAPALFSDAQTVVFSSNDRPGGFGKGDLWMSQRVRKLVTKPTPYEILTSPDYEWTKPENLGRVVNSEDGEGTPFLTAHGLTLYFDSARPGGAGLNDLWFCRRASLTAPWGAPENVGAPLNTDTKEMGPSLSADELTLVFAREKTSNSGKFELWQANRTSLASPWQTPVQLQSLGSPGAAYDDDPELSADGLTLLFHSNRITGKREDLFFSRRASRSEPWPVAQNLAVVNSWTREMSPAFSFDGLVLVFSSDREGGVGRTDLWFSLRTSLSAAWSEPRHLGPVVNSPADDLSPALSADGQTLYFRSNRPGVLGKNNWPDLWMSRRVKKATPALSAAEIFTSSDYQWTTPENLGPNVNSMADEGSSSLSADGLTLVFDSYRPGGVGNSDLWVCRRTTVDAPWSAPENLGPNVNSNQNDTNPCLSADGLAITFFSSRNPKEESPLWWSTRPSLEARWTPAKQVPVPLVNGESGAGGPMISADGLSMFLHMRDRPGNGGYDLWESRRDSWIKSWGTPKNLGPTVNSPQDDVDATLSADGCVLVFGSSRPDDKRKGLWYSVRLKVDAPWSEPKRMGKPIDTFYDDFKPELSGDGQTLIFASFDRRNGIGKSDLWMSRRVKKGTNNSADGFTNTLGMEFVRVPKGKSWLGGGGGRPGTREVEFKEDFYLGKFEVTQGEWEVVMDGSRPSFFSCPERPVETR